MIGISEGSRLTSVQRRLSTAFVALLATLALATLPAAGHVTATGALIRVVVSAEPGASADVKATLARLGGRVARDLAIIDGFSAQIPADAIDAMRAHTGVRLIVPDRTMRPFGLQPGDAGIDAAAQAVGKPSSPEPVESGALSTITKIVGAPALWEQGYTGRGVDVALVDTGVAPVNGLQPERIVNGPDLSFDYQVGGPASIDAYGHGTHMAGIIAGRDEGLAPGDYASSNGFVGVAPDSRIVNVKVGAFNGAADVSQVIAGIDWVVQHRYDNGLNIGVLNLSFGTDGVQDWRVDPLAYAVEVAWRKGIVVVVAAGNDGSTATSLANPAQSPVVLAVGASHPNGTLDRKDDFVPEWASRGTAARHVDVVAPGVSVLSLNVPGSFAATRNPQSVIADRYLRGSGTSQGAAVVSGMAALLVQKYPGASPDAIKTLLMATAHPMASDPAIVRGSGIVDGAKASKGHAVLGRPTPAVPQGSGTGSLEGARGSAHIGIDNNVLTGERDIFGSAWDGQRWSADAWNERSWQGGSWNGQRWSGQSWSGSSWSNAAWDGQSWSGQSWSGQSWSGQSWSGQSWSGQSWSGQSWSGQSWSGQSWSGQSWSGQSWSGQSWSSVDW